MGIVANSANFSVLQNTPSALPALESRVIDVESDPTFTFSSPSVPAGDGTVKFTDTAQGILSYDPPNPTFTGSFPVQYTVGDGTNSTSGVLNLASSLHHKPVTHSNSLANTVNRVSYQSCSQWQCPGHRAAPSYTFSNLIVEHR